MNDKPQDDSKTGYGKPPVHSQFKKGQSGNPKGRPKSRVSNVLARIMDVTLERDGYEYSQLELVLHRLVGRAQSDPTYMRLLLSELRHRDIFEKSAGEEAASVGEEATSAEEGASAVEQREGEVAGEAASENADESGTE
jgi:hypothetical protein